ncbi:hypothetical protein HOT02_gp123 [Staphylococcus phage phiSA_BS2]|uniref:Uncharacterized protein n=1 Tax=Staphylococcus phage phiSA_BS2 TaxID=2126724 RepID=A0A2R3ZXS7_9CAUD|nr:hypothetical protein HOT02_gp123 [Staphylococcus phage phiSA_BS2]AVR55567.1 hypothetical protein phiSABS2_123 [Staphylococcus phage phiSA_BS2]
MDINYIKGLSEESIENLIETLEGAIDIVLDEQKGEEDEYHLVKLETTIKVLEGIKKGEDFVDMWYTEGWEYAHFVPRVLDEMGVFYLVEKLNGSSETIVCTMYLNIDNDQVL